MTDEQRAMVEDSFRLVHYTLNHMRHILRAADMSYEDAWQEGCLALCRAVVSCDPTRKMQFPTFAYAAIWRQVQRACHRNRCVHKARREYKNQNTPLPVVVPIKDGMRKSPDAFGAVELRTMIDSLPERERDVIRLTVAGYKQYEIARIMGVTQTTICRSLMKTRKIIGGY